MTTAIPLTGRRFGRWTVLNDGRPELLCRCDCGTERAVSARALLNGKSQSCGCLRSETTARRNREQRLKHPIAAGDVFGRLTVLDAADRTKVACRCECGSQATVSAPHLTTGAVLSCGCLHRQKTAEVGRRNARLKIGIGDRFGLLTVVDVQNRRAVVCDCDCGTKAHPVQSSRLASGHTKSCGCLKRTKQRTHGLTDHPLYPTWQGMRARCTKPTANGYENYGGRGITIHEPWHDAAVFIRDIEASIGPRPDGMTLDRIDNDGNYEPGNVRWMSYKGQARNRRDGWHVQVTCPCCGEKFVVGRGGVVAA